jgi:hypothetical protein
MAKKCPFNITADCIKGACLAWVKYTAEGGAQKGFCTLIPPKPEDDPA